MAGSSQAPQVPVEVRGPVAEAPSGHTWPTFPITYNEAVAWHGAEFLNPGCTSESPKEL